MCIIIMFDHTSCRSTLDTNTLRAGSKLRQTKHELTVNGFYKICVNSQSYKEYE